MAHGVYIYIYIYIYILVSTDFWSPNNPDLNPVKYKVWGIMQQRVYQIKMQDVDNLRQCMIDGWSGMQQSVSFIYDAIDQWRMQASP